MKKKRKQILSFYDLAFKSGPAVKVVNLITIYRILTFPLLLYLIYVKEFDVFRWFLGASFFTDAIDGQIARRFKANSVLGARLDSIGDDLTVLAGTIGMAYAEWDFFKIQLPWIGLAFILFIFQTGYAMLKYGKTTSFHTYGAKLAAILQGLFLLSVFFIHPFPRWLFYTAMIVTVLELAEEIIMVYLIPKWKNDVKGIYWVRNQIDN